MDINQPVDPASRSNAEADFQAVQFPSSRQEVTAL